MKALFVFALLFSNAALAHIEEGTWVGATADGQTCEMTAGAQYFENNLHHPLNERIPLEVNGVKFVVGHPAVVDAEKAVAAFNHDLFQGVVATPTGANAVVVTMVHTESEEGPKNFTFITHNYKTGERKAVLCEGIRLK